MSSELTSGSSWTFIFWVITEKNPTALRYLAKNICQFDYAKVEITSSLNSGSYQNCKVEQMQLVSMRNLNAKLVQISIKEEIV